MRSGLHLPAIVSLEVPGETSLSRHAWNNTNKMNQMFSDSINLLLETFQELTRRGNEGKLFLETRNGEQYGILTVRYRPKKTSHMEYEKQQEKVAIYR